MKVSEIGQFGLIDIVARMVAESRDNKADSWQDLIDGIGDDCAVWRGSTANQLAKVDCQVEGVHFNFDITGWEDLGWKALAVNLSDIAAMGGIPRYALVSLGLPLDTEVDNVIALYRGLIALATSTGVAIAGGNMSGSPIVFADVNVLGVTGNPEGRYLSRSAAKPGDKVAVTGWLGTAAAGLEILTKELQFEPDIASCLKAAFARPQPRLAEGRILVEKGVKAGLDISDGLLADLGHICKNSGVGATVDMKDLPIRDEVKSAFGQRAREMALGGGEDYELLFTAAPSVIQEVRQAATCPVTVIGEIVQERPGQVVVRDEKGHYHQARKTGWDHFKSKR